MASGKDAFKKALSDGGPVGQFFNRFVTSDEEERAREADRKAAEAATNQLDFNKGVYKSNNAAVDDAISRIFGGSPSGTSAGRASSAEASRDPGALKYGADNYYGGGSQPGDLSRGGFSDNPDNGDANVVPDESLGNHSAESGQGGQGFYPSMLNKAEGMDADALNSYLGDISKLTPAQISDQLANLENQVKISQQARDAQGYSLDTLKGLTAPQETAQEKLIREMARRTMEGQMKGDRDAMAQSLKARGVYGSGAELASQLSGQQQYADERQLSELGANAQASKRAVDALGKYSDLGVQLGQQDIAVGNAANSVNEFNNALTEQHNQFKTKAQQANNAETAKVAGSKLNATNDVAHNIRGDAGNMANLLTTLTGVRTGTATSGANLVNNATKDAVASWNRTAALDRASDDTSEGYGPL